MRKLTKKHYLVAGVTGAVIVAGAGAAFGYWTDSGSGAGSATAGTSTPYTVTVGAPTGGLLTPGGPTDHVTFTVQNTGSGAQKVTAATAIVANSDGTAWTAVSGCSASDFSISNVSVTAANLAHNDTTTGSFDIQMKDTGANQNGCKSVTVPLYVTAS